MSTKRQEQLARNIANAWDEGTTPLKRDLLVSSGYSLSSATSVPSKIIEQKGVQEELAILGFDEATAKSVVGEILKDKNEETQHRLRAADMVFKVNATYAPEQRQNFNINVNKDIDNSDTDAILLKYEQELRLQYENIGGVIDSRLDTEKPD